MSSTTGTKPPAAPPRRVNTLEPSGKHEISYLRFLGSRCGPTKIMPVFPAVFSCIDYQEYLDDGNTARKP